MRRVLAMLGFPMIVLAVVMAWESYRSVRPAPLDSRAPNTTRAVVLGAGAAAAFVVGLMGVKERHRRLMDDEREQDHKQP